MQLPHFQNKRKRIPKWRANIENLEKLTTQGTQNEDNKYEKMVKKKKIEILKTKHVISIYNFVHIHFVYCEHLL